MVREAGNDDAGQAGHGRSLAAAEQKGNMYRVDVFLSTFNTLAEPQVCMTCAYFLPSFAGVVQEGLAGFEITAQGGLPAREQLPRVGAISAAID